MESSPFLIPCQPANPVAPYLGGKRNLAKRVIARIQGTPHLTYAEPFIGMGGVFLRRPFKARSEVINDISQDVTTLFRILQRHYLAFIDVLRWHVQARAEFDRMMAENPDTLTDLERAARFLYLQRTAFGGKVTGRNFGMALDGRGSRFDVTRIGSILEAVHDRLAGVIIERLPWSTFLTRYDRPDTLFYLDPPYFGHEDDYGAAMFASADFDQMADVLAGLKGRFLMSINDHPQVRQIFRGFTIEAVDVTYSVAAAGPGRFRELLISNQGVSNDVEPRP